MMLLLFLLRGSIDVLMDLHLLLVGEDLLFNLEGNFIRERILTKNMGVHSGFVFMSF